MRNCNHNNHRPSVHSYRSNSYTILPGTYHSGRRFRGTLFCTKCTNFVRNDVLRLLLILYIIVKAKIPECQAFTSMSCRVSRHCSGSSGSSSCRSNNIQQTPATFFNNVPVLKSRSLKTPKHNAKTFRNVIATKHSAVSVPYLFASEIHRVKSCSSSIFEIQEKPSSNKVLKQPLTNIVNNVMPHPKKEDEEAVMDVVFPLYSDVTNSIHSAVGFFRLLRKGRRKGSNGRKMAWWTDHPIFQRLCLWAFTVCASTTDPKNTPQSLPSSSSIVPSCTRIDRTQVYAGILLVHLRLAPYLGIAACHPPSREMVDEMFHKADCDDLGRIGLDEFTDILVLSFAHISSRILVYYAILLAGLPLAAKHAYALFAEPVRTALVTSSTSFNAHSLWRSGLLFSLGSALAERLLCIAVFVLIVPTLFQYMDQLSERLLKPKCLKCQPKRGKRWPQFWNYYDYSIRSIDDIS